MELRTAWLVAVLALGSSCSSNETFCTVALNLPGVEVDVGALGPAEEVCIDGACSAVADGVAVVEEPAITNATDTVRIVVRGAGGDVLAEVDDLRLPRRFPNGFDCGGDGPRGTVTFDRAGEVSVSPDVDGADELRHGG